MLVLGLTVALVLAGLGPAPVASAKEKPPPPPKPAKPLGPKSGINFDTWGPAATDDVVLKWDEQTLAEIRATRPGPTVVARALAVVHTAMYDAWAAHDATAVGTRLGGSLRRPADERTADYKSKAISYAAYRTLLDLFPTRAGDLTGFMTALGYDPADASTDPTTSAGIGNLAAQAVLEFRHRDGANQLGDEPGGTPGVRYSDMERLQPGQHLGPGQRPLPVAAAVRADPAAGRHQLRRDRPAVRHPALEPGHPLRAHLARPVRPADHEPGHAPG